MPLNIEGTAPDPPNERARNLFFRKSGIVAVIVPEMAHPFFAQFVSASESVLCEMGYQTLICNTYYVGCVPKNTWIASWMVRLLSPVITRNGHIKSFQCATKSRINTVAYTVLELAKFDFKGRGLMLSFIVALMVMPMEAINITTTMMKNTVATAHA